MRKRLEERLVALEAEAEAMLRVMGKARVESHLAASRLGNAGSAMYRALRLAKTAVCEVADIVYGAHVELNSLVSWGAFVTSDGRWSNGQYSGTVRFVSGSGVSVSLQGMGLSGNLSGSGCVVPVKYDQASGTVTNMGPIDMDIDGRVSVIFGVEDVPLYDPCVAFGVHKIIEVMNVVSEKLKQ